MSSRSLDGPYPITDMQRPIEVITAEPKTQSGPRAKKFKHTAGQVMTMAPQMASPLEIARRQFKPSVPALLLGPVKMVEGSKTSCVSHEEAIKARFPQLFGQPTIQLVPADVGGNDTIAAPLRVGCVLSGGQAAGGHNCIVGLYDYVTSHFPGSQVYGFLGGPKGVMTNNFKLLDAETVDAHRNSGGFTMLASGRDKIETAEQFASAAETAKLNDLDGLVVIGGDDSNTNACLLAEHYKAAGLKTSVVGLPKTIDGDLKDLTNCETSFGFDTAAKLYAELVGNIMVDCTSSRKYYHFVRLMGREASHLTLEVALLTQPNLAFVGEEVREKNLTLQQVVESVVELIIARRAAGMDFGVILIPEGLIEFIPQVGHLMKELNELLASRESDSNSYEGLTEDAIDEQLSPHSAEVFLLLPKAIRSQLLLDRDPHGNVQVAKIESERLIGALVEAELARRSRKGGYDGKLQLQYHYFGYEGRCAPPTAFDSNYCYGLGLTAGALIGQRCTGVMACLGGLVKPPSEWMARGVPLTAMLAVERRKGKDKPVIRKALVELEGRPFLAFAERRDNWRMRGTYAHPGPVQYAGPCADLVTMTLRLEQGLPAPEQTVSPLTQQRVSSPPNLPEVLSAKAGLRIVSGGVPSARADELFVHARLPHTYGQPRLEIAADDASAPTSVLGGTPLTVKSDLALGIVFCGRQCPGAHNVAAGLSHFLATRAGPTAQLYGFIGGTAGLYTGDAKLLTPDDIAPFVNTGGMQMLGRTSDVIRTTKQREQAAASCAKFKLDGLILVGGPVSNSDTALLAEAFAASSVPTKVVGVPATIDGDLYGSGGVEASIGFDTACRVYASLVGNLATDAASARKYWYFVRMMGRSPSHITLECANLTQPNLALIGEEVEARRMTLAEVVGEVADAVEARARNGKHFGVVLIPEGLIEFIPQMNALLKEVASARRLLASRASLANGNGGCGFIGVGAKALIDALSPYSAALLNSLPSFIRHQLLLEAQASDDKAQLNMIETERLLAELVRLELKKRKEMSAESLDTKFAPVCFYLGYQARSSMPSAFDADLALALGHGAGALAAAGATGYMATAHCLGSSVKEWRLAGVPLYSLMAADRRQGLAVAVVRPSAVDLHGASFRRFALIRERLRDGDVYCNPGPVQFHTELADGPTHGRLLLEHSGRAHELTEVETVCRELGAACWAGCDADVLKTVLAGLRATRTTLQVLHDRASGQTTTPLATHVRMSQLSAEQIATRDN